MTRALVTAFEPFDGQVLNASAEAVEELARTWDGPADLVTQVLPVSFARAGRSLLEALAQHRPDVVVCVGEAGGRAAVGLERVALNVVDARIPDADGVAPVDVPVVPGGPVAYLSRLPLKRALVAVRGAGVPVEVSQTAGTYVCNATFYALMHAIEGSPVRGGLVHVPRTSAQVAGGPGLGTTASATALRAVLSCALHDGDVPVAAGAEA